MKKVLLSLLAVAALVLSCQNYDDEFDALNAKVSSLESQISSLQGLQTALTSVQSSVSALQSAVNAIPDPSSSIAALSTSIAKILTDLGALETAVAGATTSADLDALKASLNTSLEALKALIEANSASIASLVISNAGLKTQLEALGVDVDAVLAANSTFEGNLTITNAAELAYAKSLGSKVASIKGDVIVTVDEPSATAYRAANTGNGVTAAGVNTVLSQITFVVGNVRITTDASLDLSKLTTVSGDYSVVGHDIDDSALASVGDDVYVDYDGPVSFPALATADRIYVKGTYVTTAAASVATATAAGTLVTGTTSIDFMGLTKATSISILNATHTSGGAHTSGSSAVISDSGWPARELYLSASTTSAKIGQAPVTYVTGAGLTDLELHYKADLETTAATLALYPGLSSTGSAALASLSITGAKIANATVMARRITGAVSIDVVGSTATSASGTVSFPEALNVGAISSDALVNSFPKVVTTSGVSLDNQVSVSLPEMTSSTGAIVLPKATSLSAAKLVRVGSSLATGAGAAITADLVEGSISFPALTKAGAVTLNKVTSFLAPLAKVGSIDIEEATTTVPVTLDIASVSSFASTPVVGTITGAADITTVKLNNQDATYALANFTGATSIVYNGKAAVDGTAAVNASVTSANTKLATLVLGGVLGTVSVDTNAAVATALATGNTSTALASVTTSGTIISLTVQNNFDLKTLSLGHTDDAKNATAPVIVVKNNNQLEDFSTAVKKISDLTVTGNKKLKTFNFSSISQLPNNWSAAGYSVVINISGNDTDPRSERTTTYAAASNLTTAATKDALSNWYGLTGTYTAASANTDRVYGQSSLATLKTFLALLASTYELDDTDSSNDVSFKAGTAITMEYRYDNTTAGATNASTTDMSLTGLTATAFAQYTDLQ